MGERGLTASLSCKFDPDLRRADRVRLLRTSTPGKKKKTKKRIHDHDTKTDKEKRRGKRSKGLMFMGVKKNRAVLAVQLLSF